MDKKIVEKYIGSPVCIYIRHGKCYCGMLTKIVKEAVELTTRQYGKTYVVLDGIVSITKSERAGEY